VNLKSPFRRLYSYLSLWNRIKRLNAKRLMIERLRAVLFPLFVSVFAKEEIVTPTLARAEL